MRPEAGSESVPITIAMDTSRDDLVADTIKRLIADDPRLARVVRTLEWILIVSTASSVTRPSPLCTAAHSN